MHHTGGWESLLNKVAKCILHCVRAASCYSGARPAEQIATADEKQKMSPKQLNFQAVSLLLSTQSVPISIALAKRTRRDHRMRTLLYRSPFPPH